MHDYGRATGADRVAMNDATNTFKKAPKRKGDKGRRVTLSPEAKQAYADLIQHRQDQEETYKRHLPSDSKGR
jgi:Sec-independent protein translocase protein TatA